MGVVHKGNSPMRRVHTLARPVKIGEYALLSYIGTSVRGRGKESV